MMRRLTIALLFLTMGCVRLAAQGSCQIGNTFSVFFSSYSSATVQTTGSIQFTCPNNTPYTIGLNAGTTPGATVTNRMLLRTSDQATLGYQLFSDASYTTNWGNTAGTSWVTGTGTGSQQTATIYSQIPGAEAFFSSQNGTNFTDMVTVTLSWGSYQTTRTIQVTLQQVSPGCGIGANALNFGSYTGTVLNATTTIQVACTGGTAYNVGLNAGTGVGATVTTREMTGPAGALLNYKMFSNSGRTTNWGNTIGTDTVAGTGNNGIQNLTVYGEIPSGQTVASGSYADVIITTLTY
ncbi:MAG: spore coat protein U domain-containing protein [Terracidiphilus sp.]|jgi:spore coat protein U-like protein